MGGRIGGGNCGSSSDCPQETWGYDAGSAAWTKLAAPPSCRTQSYGAFVQPNAVLLLGGDPCSLSAATDGLRWDGASWRSTGVTGCGLTSKYTGGNVGPDPSAARLLYVHSSGDTWSWDGATCERVAGPGEGVVGAAGFSENLMVSDGSSLFMVTRAGVLEWMPGTKTWKKVGAPPPLNAQGIGAVGKRTLAGLWKDPAASPTANVTWIWKG